MREESKKPLTVTDIYRDTLTRPLSQPQLPTGTHLQEPIHNHRCTYIHGNTPTRTDSEPQIFTGTHLQEPSQNHRYHGNTPTRTHLKPTDMHFIPQEKSEFVSCSCNSWGSGVRLLWHMTQTCLCVCLYVYARAWVSRVKLSPHITQTYVYVCVCVCACMCERVYLCLCVCLSVCVSVYVRNFAPKFGVWWHYQDIKCMQMVTWLRSESHADVDIIKI